MVNPLPFIPHGSLLDSFRFNALANGSRHSWCPSGYL
jgi:hypothetical protein